MSSDYGDKRACNKRFGPGGGTRRLHQKQAQALTGLFLTGPKQDRRTCKDDAFAGLGPLRSPYHIVANDNFAEGELLAA